MKHSLLQTAARVRLPARLRQNAQPSFHSAAVGFTYPRLCLQDYCKLPFRSHQREFVMQRAMYFSSSKSGIANRTRTLGSQAMHGQHERQHHGDIRISATSDSGEALMERSSVKVPQVAMDEIMLSRVCPTIRTRKRQRLCSGRSINGFRAFVSPIQASTMNTTILNTGKTKMSIAPMTTSSRDDVDVKGKTDFADGTLSQIGDTTNIDNSNDENDNVENWKRVRTIKVPQYGHDAEKAFRSLQTARKERARVKTSINVQRALYGNMLICVAKLGAWISSGSSSMMSEFVHSVVDCGNQALLLVGLRDTRNAADKRHPYGYGKSVYFWALVSALGTFFMGAGVSMSHSVQSLFHPTLEETISNEVWFVLAMSFSIDGYVFYKTFLEMDEARPKGVPVVKYMAKLRDPATLAVLMEDGAACLGIVIAIAGIAASYATSNPIYDGVAGVGISCLLAGVGLALVRVNHSFLIGQSVEKDMLEGIEKIIRNRRSIENVSGIQSQWTGPETFSFKAEVDFDGTYLSALLMPRYRAEFHKAGDDLDEELEVLLSWYAEDVIRAVEREVRHIEAVIRQQYPGAEYIELEPMSKYVDRFAIDDSFEEKLLMIEKKELKKWVRVLYENKEENAWRSVDTRGAKKSDEITALDSNVVSGSLPSDVMPERTP